MLEVMDTYSGGWNILFIAICECISICYIYGKYFCFNGNNGDHYLTYYHEIALRKKPFEKSLLKTFWEKEKNAGNHKRYDIHGQNI